MFVKQHRLPYEPLQRMFNSEVTNSDLAKLIKVSRDTITNWKQDGIPETTADKVAVFLGLHPASIWGDQWWDLANMPTLRDSGTGTDTATETCA